jgi:hypothetical protein
MRKVCSLALVFCVAVVVALTVIIWDTIIRYQGFVILDFNQLCGMPIIWVLTVISILGIARILWRES